MEWMTAVVALGFVALQLSAHCRLDALHRIERRLDEITYKATGSLFDGVPKHAKEERGDDTRNRQQVAAPAVFEVARPANVDMPWEPPHAANDTSRVRRDGEVA